MRAVVLDEPELEFARGSRHIDPRQGITIYGPADTADTARLVRIGIVGPQTHIDGLKQWLDRCREPIAAKESQLGHLHQPFPGFNSDRGFRATIVSNTRLERVIAKRDVENLATLNPLQAVQAAVELYDTELAVLHEEPNCDVVVVCRPEQLDDAPAAEPGGESEDRRPTAMPVGADFHSMLKARSLKYSRPIQIMRRGTWDQSFKDRSRAGSQRTRQDEATRAWNLHTALYYKSGGVPWRLPRADHDLTTCYVGVAFYRGLSGEVLETSVAQVFNERGDGVIVRGGKAAILKDDRQPHLSEDDAFELLDDALNRYRAEHRTSPARVVLHKTSSYTDAELAGFRSAAENQRLSLLELLWLTRSEPTRLFRTGEFPPLRGTLLSLAEDRHVLYTRGSVPAYQTYPGMYVPRPVGFRTIDTETGSVELASELLSLTKMNWNATPLDGHQPITLRTADTVADILRHLGPEETPAGRYAFYM
jgi:hypothetical protein